MRVGESWVMNISSAHNALKGWSLRAQPRSCKWSHPQILRIEDGVIQHSLINKGMQASQVSPSVSHCKASFRENSWGGAFSGVPLQSSSSLVDPKASTGTQHCTQTPNPTLLLPQGKILPQEKSVHSTKQNKTHSNFCSGETFNKKLNLIILKVFSNLNDFMTNLETHYLHFGPWPTIAPYPPPHIIPTM